MCDVRDDEELPAVVRQLVFAVLRDESVVRDDLPVCERLVVLLVESFITQKRFKFDKSAAVCATAVVTINANNIQIRIDFVRRHNLRRLSAVSLRQFAYRLFFQAERQRRPPADRHH